MNPTPHHVNNDASVGDPESVLLSRNNQGVLTLTLNRPQAFNALSSDLLAALMAALKSARDDSHVRVVVIAGSGRAFCAGHDLKEMQANRDASAVKTLFADCSRVMLAIKDLPQPVIARVHGMATAAGCQLVAQCDLAVAADSARFAVSGINLGLFCSTPAVPLSRTVGRKRAAEMLLTGDFIDSQTALNWGLINRVVAPESLDDAIDQLAQKLIAKPADVLASGKALFYRQIDMGLAAAYQDASQTIACNFMTASADEGISAFLEKRPPKW